MDRASAEEWLGTLTALQGPYGTFLLGDPAGRSPRSATIAGATNLCLWSEDFTNAAWSKTNVTLPTETYLTPFGDFSAVRLAEASANAGHGIDTAIAGLADSTAYHFSVYARAGEIDGARQWLLLQFTDKSGTVKYSYYQLSGAGVIGTATVGLTNNAITYIGSGWYRVGFSISSGSGGATPSIVIKVASADTVDAYLGITGTGLFIFGVQAVVGTLIWPYKKTTSATAGIIAYQVNGASQTGTTFKIGAAGNTVEAGDYLQLGDGASARLHKNMRRLASPSPMDLTIWPPLRSSPDNSAPFTVVNARGVFRLTQDYAWNIADAVKYGISFSAEEAL